MAEAKAVALGKQDDVKQIGAALGKIAGAYPSILDAGFKAFEAKKKASRRRSTSRHQRRWARWAASPSMTPSKIDDTVGESLDAAELKRQERRYGMELRSRSFQDLARRDGDEPTPQRTRLAERRADGVSTVQRGNCGRNGEDPAESLAAAGEAEKPGNAAAIAKAKAIVASGADPITEPEKFWSKLGPTVEQKSAAWRTCTAAATTSKPRLRQQVSVVRRPAARRRTLTRSPSFTPR